MNRSIQAIFNLVFIGVIALGCSSNNASFDKAGAIQGATTSQGSRISILAARNLPGSVGVGVIEPAGECSGFFVTIQGTCGKVSRISSLVNTRTSSNDRGVECG